MRVVRAEILDARDVILDSITADETTARRWLEGRLRVAEAIYGHLTMLTVRWIYQSP